MRIGPSHQALLVLALFPLISRGGNPDAKRLYDDLLSNYNKLVRPVSNVSEAVTVHLKLKLSQLIAVNLKSQIMTTNLWVEQFWKDYKLTWDPEEYGGVNMLHVPSDHIWRPDIVLYNNADGNFEVTLATKATLFSTGLVEWKPPAIYHSSCEMDVEYFPFDEQTCVMKFGSWTYDGFQVDLRHLGENTSETGMTTPDVIKGIDLSEYYMSVEWDILAVPAMRNVKFYTCCDEPYLDITFNITMRRKTLFYTVNLIIPCMGISFLTILVFYLPSDSGEKVSLSISILLSLTVFFLLLAEIIPPTSLVVPLLGKFVLFTMILDTFSICVTVVVLNVHFRTPQTHTMAPWVRRVFIHILPRLLAMRRPHYEMDKHRRETHGVKLMYRSCNGIKVGREELGMGCAGEHRYYQPLGDSPDLNHCSGPCRVSCGGGTCVSPPLSYRSASPSPPPPPHRGRHHKKHIQVHLNNDLRPLNGGCRVHGTTTTTTTAVAAEEDEEQLYDIPNSDPQRSHTNLEGYSLARNEPDEDDHEVGHRHVGNRGNSVPQRHRPKSRCQQQQQQQQDPHRFRSNHRGQQPDKGGRGGPGGGRLLRHHYHQYLPKPTEGGSASSLPYTQLNTDTQEEMTEEEECSRHHACPQIQKALTGILFIAEHKKRMEESTKIIEDWKYVAMVLDRLFLWIFTVAVLVGTAGIILQAPTLYDDRTPIDIEESLIGLQLGKHRNYSKLKINNVIN